MKAVKLLSLVVPAYKQERTIIKDVTNTSEILSSLHLNYEIIVVVDGFVDKTYELLEMQIKKKKFKNIKVIGYEKNKGKGFAIQQGFKEAKGDIVGFMDAGLDLDATCISLLLDLMMWENADIVVGSKLHPESKVNYPLYRTIMSWGYRTLTRILFGLSVRDTQVGLKFFKRSVVKKVFPKILVKAFAFDIEILAVAHAFGFTRIYEGPIKLNFQDNSSITSSNFWKVIYFMLWDTFAVFYRLKVLHFYNRK